VPFQRIFEDSVSCVLFVAGRIRFYSATKAAV
jgi:hypothetical protein